MLEYITEPAWQHMLYIAVDTVRVRTVLAFREAQPKDFSIFRASSKSNCGKSIVTYQLEQSDSMDNQVEE
jgi:hypothetical protein